MSEKEIKILLRVDRQIALQNYLHDYFIPLLLSRGYSTEDLLQALGSWTFDNESKKVAHHLWDAAAEVSFSK